MKVEEKLAELGLELPEVPAPLAAYVPAKRVGNLVFVSGQGPIVHGSSICSGLVGTEVSEEAATAAARQVALNLLAALKWAIGDLDQVVQIVSVRGWVASGPGFGRQPYVINGCSLLLEQVFGEAGKHARCALGTNELPLGISVEIEMVAEVA